MFYTRQLTVLDGSSGQSSTRTSNPILVADAAQMSVSWMTQVATASTLTVQGSNDHGMTAANQNWSTVSLVAGAGIFTITPGARWIRFVRPAVDSQGSVVLNYAAGQ